MAKKPKDIFNLSFENYFRLIKLVLTNPNQYAKSIPVPSRLRQPLIFFVINFCLVSLINITISAAVNRNFSVFFNGIDTILLVLPLVVLGLFIATLIIFLIARILGGKGNFRDSVGASAYSSLPIIFSFVPYVFIAALVLEIYILCLAFARVQQFSRVKSAVSIFLPLIILTAILFSLGIFNSYMVKLP